MYEIGRLFRNEGMDPKHNPEFTTVEAYVAYSDIEGMMALNEGLFESVAMEVFGKTDFTLGDKQISLKGAVQAMAHGGRGQGSDGRRFLERNER